MRVKVRDDATMWNEGGCLSTYAGMVGETVLTPGWVNGTYEIFVEFEPDETHPQGRGGWFFWEELEAICRDCGKLHHVNGFCTCGVDWRG